MPPTGSVLDDVVAPPYDVISPEDQAGLEARSPYNSVRVELPRDDPPRDRYQVAGQLLGDWRAEGILRPDDQPCVLRLPHALHRRGRAHRARRSG